MKTIRSYSVPAFSIMLLLSGATAQSMDRALFDVDNVVGLTVKKSDILSAVTGGIKASGQYVAEKSKAAYSALPTAQQAGVMLANVADEVHFRTVVQHPRLTAAGAAVAGAAVIGTGIKMYKNMQKRSQLLKAIDAELNATFNALVNGTIHEFNLEELTALLNKGDLKLVLQAFINAAKLYNRTNMEDVTYKALKFHYAAAKHEIAVALKGEKAIKAEKVAKETAVKAIEKATFLANVEEITRSFGVELQRNLATRRAQALVKVPGELKFEQALTPTVNWIPKEYPKLKEAWRKFGFAAIEYDRAENNDLLGSLVDAMNGVFDEIEALSTSTLEKAKNTVVNATVAAKDMIVSKTAPIANIAVNTGVIAKNAAVAHPYMSGGVAALATGSVVAKTGLVGKAVALFNRLDTRAIMQSAATGASKAVTFARNHKGKIGATAGAIATGAFGAHTLYKMHGSFLSKDVTVAPIVEQDEVVQPADSNSQMIGY